MRELSRNVWREQSLHVDRRGRQDEDLASGRAVH